MPFDGSGNYVPPSSPTFPAVAGQTIVSSYYNAVINDLAAAVNLCITRDGQGKPSAAINWNGQNLTGVNVFSCTGNGTVGGTLTVSGGLSALSAAITNNLTAGTLNVAGAAAVGSLTTGAPIGTAYGGTGLNCSTAANGQLLIGTGGGLALATLTAGANITITNSAGGITIAASGAGGGGTTSFTLTADASGAGMAAGGTFNGSAAKTISYNSIGAKPITPQIQTVTSAATVTPTFSNDLVIVSAQAAALTLANPTGTAVDGWGMVVRIKDNGTAQTIAYGTQYRAVDVTLPTTTVSGKWVYLCMIFNNADTAWDIIGVAQQ